MQLKSPKLPPAAAAYYRHYYYYSCCPDCDSYYFPFPVPCPGPPSRFKTTAQTTTPHLVLLSPTATARPIQLTSRPPRGGRQDNHYHRGRLKNDPRGTSTRTWRQHILIPSRMTSSYSHPNQPPYLTLPTVLSVYIEGQSSTHSPDNYHLRK
jgi:hypothetical protein